MFEHIPKELRDLPQWVCRRGKIPINPRTGKGAKAGQPDTWTSFGDAVHASTSYDGIGFEFNDNGLVGIDLDHVIDPDTGEVDQDALHAVNLLDSYTEYSPSGTGLHIIVRGDIPAPGKKSGGREMYKSGRYFTITGKPFGDPRPLAAEDRSKELAVLWARWFPDKDKPAPAPQPVAPSELDTSAGGKDYLAIGLEKDEKLRALWNGERPNGNESADDQALINKLAYWLNRDREQMKAAFLSSPHFHSKDEAHQRKAAERADYLDRTAAEAIRTCTQTAQETDARYQEQRYHSAQKDFGAPDFELFTPFEKSSTAQLTDFPLECLPQQLRDYVQAVATQNQVAVDMPAVVSLAVVALCVHGKYIINPKPGWVEPVNLFTVTVARPSERKSPVLRCMLSPVYDFIREENHRRAPDIAEYQTKKSILSRRLNHLSDVVAKEKGKGKPTASMEDVKRVRMELDELEEVKPLRLLADDATPEALTSIMAQNGGKIAIVSAEGGTFDIVAGRYSDKTNMDIYLKGYSGDYLEVDRKGRESERIEHPVLTMALMIQPSVLSEIMANDKFRGRGLLARFLYSFPQSHVGERSFDVPAVSDFSLSAYRSLLFDLLSVEDQGGTRTLKIDSDAFRLAESFFYEIERQLTGALEDVEEWAGKLHGNTMRIAALLHCAQYGHEAEHAKISAATMQNAITIGRYFTEHAKAAFSSTESKDTKDAKYILRRVQKSGKAILSKRELLTLCNGHFDKAAHMQPALDLLTERGYLYTEEVRTGERGRPTKIFHFRENIELL